MSESDEAGATASPTPTVTLTTTPTATPVTCEGSWAVVPVNAESSQWFQGGLDAIRNASTNDEAAAAASVWLDGVRTVPVYLAAAADQWLGEQVDPSTLVAGDCVSDEGVMLDVKLRIAFATGEITPEDAPATAWNTGVNDGVVVTTAQAGITGDLAAIQIVTADGRVGWVMARCGNMATPDQPNLPPGETDNPPGPTPNPTPTPTPTPTSAPKKATEDVLVNPGVSAQVRGPGTTPVGVDPAPAQSPVDSATGCDGACPSATQSPAPTPTATAPPSGPGPAPQPDPTQEPEPAPSAPAPSAPATGVPEDF